MKISQNIDFLDFKKIKTSNKIFNIFKDLKKKPNQIIQSFTKTYDNSYSHNLISKLNKFKNINLIGMGGSTLGAQAIYSFFKQKVNKEFNFIDNLDNYNSSKNKNTLNLVVSKSGNTLETITNFNFHIKKYQKNIFITEKKRNFLNNLASKLKAEVISHNNFIGGRYSVLSEVGMLPADLMGLNHSKFRQFNNLVKNKKFINSLISNVSNILELSKKKKTNSIILNYDQKSLNFFYWYQQLVAESLGKKGKGLLPVISNMPKDNHSLMQFYLSGRQNNFFTFFFVNDKFSKKISDKRLLGSNTFLMNKSLNDIKIAQFNATRRVFKKKKIPHRSFLIKKRDEKTLGELFIFFMLETILLGRALNVNPYDQPSVELIKTETRKFF